MQREIAIADGCLACNLCLSQGTEDEPLVHLDWCEGLFRGLQKMRTYTVTCAILTALSVGALSAMGIWVNHTSLTIEEAKHELIEHLAQSFPPTVYYDPESGNMKVLLPPQPHEGEDGNHAKNQAEEESPDSQENR